MYSAVCIFATCKSPATITEHLWVSGAVLTAADTQRFTVTNVLQYRVEFKSCWDTMLIKVPNKGTNLGNQNMSSQNSPRLAWWLSRDFNSYTYGVQYLNDMQPSEAFTKGPTMSLMAVRTITGFARLCHNLITIQMIYNLELPYMIIHVFFLARFSCIILYIHFSTHWMLPDSLFVTFGVSKTGVPQNPWFLQ